MYKSYKNCFGIWLPVAKQDAIDFWRDMDKFMAAKAIKMKEQEDLEKAKIINTAEATKEIINIEVPVVEELCEEAEKAITIEEVSIEMEEPWRVVDEITEINNEELPSNNINERAVNPIIKKVRIENTNLISNLTAKNTKKNYKKFSTESNGSNGDKSDEDFIKMLADSKEDLHKKYDKPMDLDIFRFIIRCELFELDRGNLDFSINNSTSKKRKNYE